MTDYEHLCRAIAADPDADGPRLSLADWLQENAGTVRCGYCQGHHVELGCRRCVSGWAPDGRLDRAAFIIGSIAGRSREFIPTETGPTRRTDWYDRGQAASFDGFCLHGWNSTTDPLAPAACYVEDAGVRPHRIGRETSFDAAFRRGMACAISLSASSFVKYSRRLFAMHPIVEVVLSGLNVIAVPRGGCIVLVDVTGRADLLPRGVYDRLVGGERRHPGIYYRSGDLAGRAISHACVTFARAELDLPPLAPAWLDKNAPLLLDKV